MHSIYYGGSRARLVCACSYSQSTIPVTVDTSSFSRFAQRYLAPWLSFSIGLLVERRSGGFGRRYNPCRQWKTTSKPWELCSSYVVDPVLSTSLLTTLPSCPLLHA